VQQDLGNVHAMHRRVLSAFPDATDRGGEVQANARQQHALLYRVDIGHDARTSVLVQSTTLPDWSALPGDYLADTFEPNPASKAFDGTLDRLTCGQGLRFRMRVNATKRLHLAGKGVRGKRVELFGEQRLLEWLLRKAEQHGFALCRTTLEQVEDQPRVDQYAVSITQEPKVRGHRASAHLTFGSTLFEGQLMVTEATRFREALGSGIGAAKAYGFGLLSIAPARA
jgi:CRISPR system Cascade subunit CasE